jgi:16S rRNA (cytidine1402-2'-O)-methyltransferase
MAGVLYLVSTPIGNYDDMTFRALHVLKHADIIVCEERKEGEKLLRHFGITKPVEQLNEHNEAAATFHIGEYLRAGQAVALISDCGTPVFSDPGQLLVRKAIGASVQVIPVPGASSLLPALIISGFLIDQFVFCGWLSPKKERRRAELRRLREEKRTMVLMDTPYRLLPLLRDLGEVFGEGRRICVAYNLTLPDEEVFRGNAVDLHRRLSQRQLKGEFVIVIENREAARRE